jgi:hypothetical protein
LQGPRLGCCPHCNQLAATERERGERASIIRNDATPA